MNWGEFFAMGGYAFHVWTSWGLTLIVLVSLYAIPKLKNAKLREQIKRQIEREQKLEKQSSDKNN